jgi:crotonobetainyl-CoA:carnitine CoA-transferase CaiB-like acyl-CoA transferase
MLMSLDGIKIIDWTIGQQGPLATSMLGDLGAEVIKIEQPIQGDPGRGLQTAMGRAMTGLPEGRNYYFENNNRSKRSITIDVTKEEGQDIIYRLAKTADVFVNNFRRRVAVKNHLEYETLSRYNSQLIYAHANAFGLKGPDSDKPGFDYLAQARSGLMTSTGEPGMAPQVVVGGVSDQIGAIFLGYAIVIALLARERHSIGQEVDVSLLGSTVTVLGLNVAARTMLGTEFPKHERTKPGNPLWNHYQCADGKWLALSMLQSDRCWPDFCRVIGIEELQNDQQFTSMEARTANSVKLVSILNKIFAGKPRSKWLEILDKALSEGAEIIYTRLNTINDLPDDPQITANDYITNFDHPVFGKTQVLGIPYKFSKTPGVVGGTKLREAPELGQHTEEVLLEAGYTWEDITGFKDREII